MRLLTLTITGEADKVEAAIICAMNAVHEKFPDQLMKLVGKDTEYDGPPVVLKDCTPESWL